jgi:hypothetical protein
VNTLFSVAEAPKDWIGRASVSDDPVTAGAKNSDLQIREKWRGYCAACFQALLVRAKIYA